MIKKILLVVGMGAWLAVGTALAEVKLHSLFSDNAVLQQGMPVPVWGMANDGEKVTVAFAGQSVTTTAHGGRWMVKLKPMQANAKPQTMTVTGSNTITVTNLLVGEVWFCSGQSNMAMPVGATSKKNSVDLTNGGDSQLRLFYISTPRTAPEPLSTVKGNWSEPSAASLEKFSKVGYFFGRDLRKSRQVPVGLIHGCAGGHAAEDFMSAKALKGNPQLAHYTPDPGLATSRYNGLIAPTVPFAIAGVIWYQGEHNAAVLERAKEYRIMLPALIKNWRDDWGQGDFPFLIVQIAPYKTSLPELREAQLLTWQKTPKTAMTVITDLGAALHPGNKDTVGARLALAARAIAYGEQIEYSGPVYQSLKVDGNRAVLSFTHIGGGLVAKGGELKGFTIAGADKKFVPATAKIEGETVVVTSAEVPVPVAVRHGWANIPVVNLFNKADLPASPFRTDVE